MSGSNSSPEEALIAQALRSASDTRVLLVAAGVRHSAAAAFAAQFRSAPAIVVADENTFAAAGKDVCDSFCRAGQSAVRLFIFGPDVYADERSAGELQAAVSASDAIPVAVGAGTVNDLT